MAAKIHFDDTEDLIDICMDNVFKEQEEGIAMASEVLLSISKDEVERARLMSEYKYELDMQSMFVDGKRQGRAEGEKKIIELLKSGKSPEEIIKEYGL